ncbi:MAG: hypothetical protein H6970_09115 [Gammaproteobacteria bacterium]|nr:hypothetical protein [Gammaproteobacteria bacterium]
MPSQSTLFVFSDLDDTLFQTERKCPSQGIHRPAAVDRQGQTLSYFTAEQGVLLTLIEQGTVIPVTGRNTAALERVHMSFNSYRITSHGALITGADGNPDEEWLIMLQAQQAIWAERMEYALKVIARTIERNEWALRCRIIEDQGWPVYVSVKGDERDLASLRTTALALWCENGARIHSNGQNMALLPAFADKERAVRFLMRRIRDTGIEPLFLGLGDSVTDMPFLRLCHYAITPRGSQIHASWT